jgi:hypothetical protein
LSNYLKDILRKLNLHPIEHGSKDDKNLTAQLQIRNRRLARTKWQRRKTAGQPKENCDSP